LPRVQKWDHFYPGWRAHQLDQSRERQPWKQCHSATHSMQRWPLTIHFSSFKIHNIQLLLLQPSFPCSWA
jgi:hypothetical protein